MVRCTHGYNSLHKPEGPDIIGLQPAARLAPGWIGGPNVETFLGWESEARNITRDEVRTEIEANIPLRKIPPQDDIANSVVFFVSPWSRVVTGQTLDVNGGEFLG